MTRDNKPEHISNTNDIPVHIKINMRNVVMRQTDYNEKKAETELVKHKYDVMSVVREYMNPIKEPNKNEKVVTNTNQQIYREIRGMMDNASWHYRKNKEQEEAKALLRAEYIRRKESAKENMVNKINTHIQ
tara:strand:+ start:466 stop:858 length:393 start_codon:yes stop_codon:yes gene_type:complete